MSDTTRARVEIKGAWREAHHRMYDPSFGYAHDFRQDTEVTGIPSFDIWPSNGDPRKADLKIITLGGSTTDYRQGAKWARFLAENLNKRELKTIVFNGGCGGYSSSQELKKLYRDTPALAPTHVICLSGINDFVGWSPRQHPFLNPYQLEVGQHLVETTNAFDGFTAGLPTPHSPAETWLRNGRTMRFMTEDQGATFLQVLQPTLGSSPYDMNPQEETWLQNEGEEYFNNMLNFYRHIKTSMREERHSHIFDLTRLFTDEKGVYIDSRHTNDAANELIANAIVDELISRKAIQS